MNVIGKILTATTPATETQTVNIAHASASSATARPFVYSKNHCWQYDIRLNNREQDLLDAGLTEEEAATIKVGDLSFRYVDKTETAMCKRIVQFIRRHEWLGTMPLHPTHRFVAEYKGQLAGVIILSTPNAFSKLLGEGTKDLERLISRGACVSWSPKNTASKLLMDAIDWMVTNTQFRLFSCYADPEAFRPDQPEARLLHRPQLPVAVGMEALCEGPGHWLEARVAVWRDRLLGQDACGRRL
jgi:hypothetical protein